ncbi:TPA: hypothetical protein L9493_002924 [Klebsiella variicola subsp. variicola]|nr:hypothetical protein [Klebsiella variicola subsp. variicola]HBS3665449.1 hypothetical protein [Klebsiella variicola subsp. variicola]
MTTTVKTIREIELEIELAKSRQQIIRLSIMKMHADYAFQEQEIERFNCEMVSLIKQE